MRAIVLLLVGMGSVSAFVLNPTFSSSSQKLRAVSKLASRPPRMALGLRMQMNPQNKKESGVGIIIPESEDTYSDVGELEERTDTALDAYFNIAKAIVGAGSFALPWVCKNEGVAGGVITMAVCGVLSSVTMDSLIQSKIQVEKETGAPDLSYVEVTRETLGEAGAKFVFLMTVLASVGVCSSYISFVGSTLASMAAQEGNIFNTLLPNVSKETFGAASLLLIAPISFLRSFSFLSFTSTLGVVAVFAAVLTVTGFGLVEQGSAANTIEALTSLPLWPESVDSYFKSFGSVSFLFAVNFLIFPIERNMARPSEFTKSVEAAVATTGLVNIAFGALGLSFFGASTSDIVTNNLGPGPVLTAVRCLLCIDLLFTYPLVLAAGREIVENSFLRAAEDGAGQMEAIDKQWELSGLEDQASGDLGPSSDGLFVGPTQLGIRSALVGLTFMIGQTKGFGLITNIAGGLAQGSLAFIIPPALQLKLRGDQMSAPSKALLVCLMCFGGASAVLTTYEALVNSQ